MLKYRTDVLLQIAFSHGDAVYRFAVLIVISEIFILTTFLLNRHAIMADTPVATYAHMLPQQRRRIFMLSYVSLIAG